jgi:hypothetical protein
MKQVEHLAISLLPFGAIILKLDFVILAVIAILLAILLLVGLNTRKYR